MLRPPKPAGLENAQQDLIHHIAMNKQEDPPFQTLLLSVINAAGVVDQEFVGKLRKFHDDGFKGTPPERPIDPRVALERKLEQILGYPTTIEAPIDTSLGMIGHQSINVCFSREGKKFKASELSDGEKQILFFSVFLMGQSQEEFAFLVDEPELFLNEAAAISLWRNVEEQFPRAVFVYATHNLSFATRPEVAKTYFMSMQGEIIRLEKEEPVPHRYVRTIAGARVQLLRSEKAPVFCEDGLAQLILRDLLPEQETMPVAVGSWKNVRAAVTRERGWEQLRSDATKFCGVIDLDTRGTDEVAALEEHGVFCFPVYESESFLLSPEVAIWRFQTAGRSISEADYRRLLVGCAGDRLEATLHKIRSHLVWKNPPSLVFTTTPTALASVQVTEPKDLDAEFRAKAAPLYLAIQNEDSDAILRLFKGKFLYRSLVHRAKTTLDVTLPTEPAQAYLESRAMVGFREAAAKLAWLSELRGKIIAYLH
jgi:hypothetical protein